MKFKLMILLLLVNTTLTELAFDQLEEESIVM